MDPLEGRLLAGKYKVERVLGEGGMGVVVAAMHQQLEQRVALKFLVPSALENAEAVGRFVREARSAVRLTSEHVARVIDVGTLETGAPFIVMEYLDGSDLAEVVSRRGPLPVVDAVDYVLQACEAIAEAHASDIVHRDLKPANLFLTRRRDGTTCVKVLDFGIAKITGKGAEPSLTQTTGGMGTPFYMSPEQMRSAKNADVRSDIWSIGIILYELLTGSLAFGQETLPELCTAILHDPPAPPRQRRPDIPPRLEGVVLTCLAKDPGERYQDVGELALELCRFGGVGAAASVERIQRILSSRDDAVPGRQPPSSLAADVSTPGADDPTLLDARQAQSTGVTSGQIAIPKRAMGGRAATAAGALVLIAATFALFALREPRAHDAGPQTLGAESAREMKPATSAPVPNIGLPAAGAEPVPIDSSAPSAASARAAARPEQTSAHHRTPRITHAVSRRPPAKAAHPPARAAYPLPKAAAPQPLLGAIPGDYGDRK